MRQSHARRPSAPRNRRQPAPAAVRGCHPRSQASPSVLLSRIAIASSGLCKLGHLCRLMSLQAMTHGPATCIGMVDEALKRPPSQIGKNMPTRPSPAVEIDVVERLTVGVPSPRRTRAAGSGAEALPRGLRPAAGCPASASSQDRCSNCGSLAKMAAIRCVARKQLTAAMSVTLLLSKYM